MYMRGLITEGERKEKVVELWSEATDDVAERDAGSDVEANPIYMMANVGRPRNRSSRSASWPACAA